MSCYQFCHSMWNQIVRVFREASASKSSYSLSLRDLLSKPIYPLTICTVNQYLFGLERLWAYLLLFIPEFLWCIHCTRIQFWSAMQILSLYMMQKLNLPESGQSWKNWNFQCRSICRVKQHENSQSCERIVEHWCCREVTIPWSSKEPSSKDAYCRRWLSSTLEMTLRIAFFLYFSSPAAGKM